MIAETKGIVLRTVKYGETSAVVTVLTEQFGLQTYLVNGVFSNNKKSLASFYQPSAILEMQVYHNPLKNLQRIKEVKWAYLYKDLFSNILKNTIALYLVELVLKTVRLEEKNEELYTFIQQAFLITDQSIHSVAAEIPVLFSMKLTEYLGLAIKNNYNQKDAFFNPREGAFGEDTGEPFLVRDENLNLHFSQLLSIAQVSSDERGSWTEHATNLNGTMRRKVLRLMEQFFQWHVEGFSELKTLGVYEQLF